MLASNKYSDSGQMNVAPGDKSWPTSITATPGAINHNKSLTHNYFDTQLSTFYSQIICVDTWFLNLIFTKFLPNWDVLA